MDQKPVIDISSTSSDEDVKIVPPELDDKSPPIVTIDSLDNSSDSDKPTISRHSPKLRKKHKRKKIKTEPKYEKKVDDLYFEDRFKDKVNFRIDTFHSRARPAYYSIDKCLGFVPSKKKKKETFQRYYVVKVDKKSKKGKAKEREEPTPEWCVDIEEETKSRTQEFNEALAKDPQDVKTWIEYIKFQVKCQPIFSNPCNYIPSLFSGRTAQTPGV